MGIKEKGSDSHVGENGHIQEWEKVPTIMVAKEKPAGRLASGIPLLCG